jgi:hypothetical protein
MSDSKSDNPDGPQLHFRAGEITPQPDVIDLRARLPEALVMRLDALARMVADAQTRLMLDPQVESALAAAADGWIREVQTILNADRIRAIHNPPQPLGHCTVVAANRLLNISERTIRRWIEQGKVMPVKIKGRVFVDLARLFQLRRISRIETDQDSTPRWTA